MDAGHGLGGDGMPLARVVHPKRMILKRAQKDPKRPKEDAWKRQHRCSCTTKSMRRHDWQQTPTNGIPWGPERNLAAASAIPRFCRSPSPNRAMEMPEIETSELQIDRFSERSVYCATDRSGKESDTDIDISVNNNDSVR